MSWKEGLKWHIVHLPASLSPTIFQYGQIAANIALGDTAEPTALVNTQFYSWNVMGKGESVHLVALKRQSFSATVNIVLTNNTEQHLDIRKEWVKGGEAINRPVRYTTKGNKMQL